MDGSVIKDLNLIRLALMWHSLQKEHKAFGHSPLIYSVLSFYIYKTAAMYQTAASSHDDL